MSHLVLSPGFDHVFSLEYPFFFFIIPTSLQLASTFHPLIELNLLNLIQPLRFQAYTYNMLQLICKFNFPPLGSLGQGLYCIYFGIFGGYMVISDKRNEWAKTFPLGPKNSSLVNWKRRDLKSRNFIWPRKGDSLYPTVEFYPKAKYKTSEDWKEGKYISLQLEREADPKLGLTCRPRAIPLWHRCQPKQRNRLRGGLADAELGKFQGQLLGDKDSPPRICSILRLWSPEQRNLLPIQE